MTIELNQENNELNVNFTIYSIDEYAFPMVDLMLVDDFKKKATAADFNFFSRHFKQRRNPAFDSDNDFCDTDGFYYNTYVLTMDFYFKEDFFKIYTPNRFYFFQTDFKDIAAFIDATKYKNETQYNRVCAYLTRHCIEFFKEGNQFIEIKF